MNKDIKINLMPNGETKNINGGLYNVYYAEISKEEYERLQGIGIEKLNKAYREDPENNVRIMLYGFYGCELTQENDKYFYGVRIGNFGS